MARCLICNAPVEPFMSFGRMPIANGFLSREEFENEFFFELKVGHCVFCHLVQLTELLDPSQLFHSSYAYFSSISERMARHFETLAATVTSRYLVKENPFVVEIGSNDGILLRNFMRAGIRHLGIEPSANVARAALEAGVQTVCRFFDEQSAAELRQEHGPSDVVLGANVICHLPNIHSVMRGIDKLLTEEGVFIFEEPYLGDIIQKTAYDQIYDEHFSYFSLQSLSFLFRIYDMEIIDVTPQAVHGGSMRYVVGRRGVRNASPAVEQQFAREAELGLTRPETYDLFSRRVCESRENLVGLLMDLRREGKRVAAYGATSKSTTVTNFCGIGPDLLDYISDTTAGKQGKYNPGTHIPIVPYERFKESYPDYAVLFAWNHSEEILAKESAFERQGGRFITYVPSVRTLTSDSPAWPHQREPESVLRWRSHA